jgi:hypothetical protein
MTIKFLMAHSVAGVFPPVSYSVGQIVEGLSTESEGHFVNRGSAAYVIDDKLYNADGKEVAEPKLVTTEVVTVADNRDEPENGGKLPDGTLQRASAGPGDVVVTTAATTGTAKAAKAKSAKGKK